MQMRPFGQRNLIALFSRTAPVAAVALLAGLLGHAAARAESAPAADAKSADAAAKPADAPVAADGVPALPAPADATANPGAGADASPDAGPAAGPLTPEDLAALKAELKAELQTELRAQLQNEMEAAARDAGTQKAAQGEWQEERWIEEVKPTLNFLQFDGYFRTRFDLFNRLDLGTFDPLAAGGVGKGTSSVPPPVYYRPYDGTDCSNGTPGNFPGDTCTSTREDNQTLLSMNMRLRLDPTLNVSDDIRIKSTVDIFDNLVLGSTPESLPGFANNPSLPLPLFSSSQLAPQVGMNSIYDALRIKRVWAEIMTPLGELRVGRMAQHFGLGLLANGGNQIDSDYGDNADQILFATRVGGIYIVPGYSLSSSGANGRGGGAGVGGDGGLGFYPGELGQRYNLDLRDDVHSVLLTVAKKDKEEDITEQLNQGNVVLNYGVFAVYRTQAYDVPNYYSKPAGQSVSANPVVSPEEYVKRNANAGIGSLWARFQWEKLKIEGEASGILGLVDGTGVTSDGVNTADPDLRVVKDGAIVNQPLWILQGGLALESSYKLLNDALTLGLDFGIASGDDAWGMGLRPVVNQHPAPGDLDGKQYGECLENDAAQSLTADDGTTVDCVNVDNNVTNFRFDPDYQIDLILFREILGTVTDAFYVKPHIGYALTDALGVRADLIYSHALFSSSTPGVVGLFGNQDGGAPLGMELDGTGYYGSADGFYTMLQAGFFVPFGAFSHYDDGVASPGDVDFTKFGTPQWAWTAQLWTGVRF